MMTATVVVAAARRTRESAPLLGYWAAVDAVVLILRSGLVKCFHTGEMRCQLTLPNVQEGADFRTRLDILVPPLDHSTDMTSILI